MLENVQLCALHESYAIHFALAYKTFAFPLETLLLIEKLLCSFANVLDFLAIFYRSTKKLFMGSENFCVLLKVLRPPWNSALPRKIFALSRESFAAPPRNFTNALRSAKKLWIVFCKTFGFVRKCFAFTWQILDFLAKRLGLKL